MMEAELTRNRQNNLVDNDTVSTKLQYSQRYAYIVHIRTHSQHDRHKHRRCRGPAAPNRCASPVPLQALQRATARPANVASPCQKRRTVRFSLLLLRLK